MRLNKQQLFHVVEAAIIESGWNFLRLTRPSDHPARYSVYRDNQGYPVRVYIWNLTHGGGAARPVHEYRIQITGVSRFLPEPNGKTLILGWWNDVGVFAGFDYTRHTGVLGSSPSMQIGEEALRASLINGFAPHWRGRDEIAIAFRPDFIGTYIETLEMLHQCAKVPAEVGVLNRISEDPAAISEDVIQQSVAGPRRYAVTSTRRALRDMNFRARVLTVYSHRCALCGVQLRLVEGAHILPVAHPDSTDETNNGIALCVLHHRAYDRGLVTFDTDFRTRLNAAQLDELRQLNLGGGRREFEAAVRPILLLPPDRRDRPKAEYVTAANRLRGWNL